MNWVDAVILGVVEGLTEFLPVSSTGHLILTAHFLGLPQSEFMKTFEISIQVGAILAVLWVYWRSFLTDVETLKRVLIAFLPTAIIGVLLYRTIKQFLFAGQTTVLVSLALGGVVLILFDRLYRVRENVGDAIRKMPLKNAAAIGVIQTLAVIPGVSRAGATILGGLCLGLDRRAAVQFSFLLAVPTLVAATALDILKTSPVINAGQWRLLFLGGAVSFVVALVSIRFFLSFIQKRGFTFFGIYRLLLAVFYGWLVL